MKKITDKLEELLEFGGTKRDILFLVISAVALLISIFDKELLPFDPAWVAIILCGIPIILEAVIGLVTEFDIKADVLVSLTLIASVLIREDFAAGEVAFIMQLGGILEELTVAKARAGIEKLVHLTPQTARVLTEAGEKTIPAEQLSEHPLGKAVVNCYRQEMKRELLSTGQFEMIPGRGVSCEVDTHTILAGNVDMLRENRINFPADVEKQAEEFLNQGCTMIY